MSFVADHPGLIYISTTAIQLVCLAVIATATVSIAINLRKGR